MSARRPAGRAPADARARTRDLGLVLALALGLLVAASRPALGQPEVPILTGRVNDYAEMISAEDEVAIEAVLEQLETDTGAQVVVLTVPDLEGLPIEDYSIEVVEAWELGREAQDDGVLLLVSRDDRSLRIEVGYGLEGDLTALYSKRIISDVMVPRFREGAFGPGILAGVQAIDATIRGGEAGLAAMAGEAAEDVELDGGEKAIAMVIFLVVSWALGLPAVLAPAVFAWIAYLVLSPLYLLVPGAILGWPVGFVFLALWLIGFPIARRMLRDQRKRIKWTTGGLGGGFGGWTDGSGSGGFGGFSGGFSGGGGSFGGGGASGSW